MPPKIALGYYMFTPMLGGAETYLRDLLWGIDRERFEITLYYEPWPDLDAFLDLERCPAIRVRPIRVIEPLGHTRIDRRPGSRQGQPQAPEKASRGGAPAEGASRLRRLYRHVPFRRPLSTFVLTSLRYIFWGTNTGRLAAAFRGEPLDVLHIVNGGYPGAASAQMAALVSKSLGVPACVMTVCSTASPRGFPAFLERRIDRALHDCVKCFVVPAERPGQALVQRRGFRPSKLHKIPWGLSAPAPPQADVAAAARRRLGLPPTAPVAGMIGRFTPLKGQRTFVDAVALLRERIPDLRAVLVGDGPLRPEIERRAASLGIANVTLFTGHYGDVFEALRAFDAFVLPSEIEGLPYVVLEAMSQAKPVVAADVGGIPEAVLSGETGFVVPPRNPLALAEKIADLLANPDLARTMGLAGYRRYEAHFTLPHMLAQHEGLYERLAAPRAWAASAKVTLQ